MSTVCTTAPFLASPGASARPTAKPSGVWQLRAGQALGLRASVPHSLRVQRGRIWVTLDANARHASEDLVLGPGDSLAVPAGEHLVMEPWSDAGAAYRWDAA